MMKYGIHILCAVLWYLGGCCVGALIAPEHILHAVFKAPRGVLLHFQYPDILMGSVGIGVVVISFCLAVTTMATGAATARWRLFRAGAYATAMAVGLFGGFAAVLEQVI